jgi:hypothetical protein
MSELFELMHHATEVAQTAKEAMSHSLAADKTTEALARKILEEAKRLLPLNKVLQVIDLSPAGDLPWTSVRSAMEATSTALSEANSSSVQASNARRVSQWG